MLTKEEKYNKLFDSYKSFRKEHPINESKDTDESYKWQPITSCQGTSIGGLIDRVSSSLYQF